MGKVEPFGADEVREVVVRRRREEMDRQREDRARREAYAADLGGLGRLTIERRGRGRGKGLRGEQRIGGGGGGGSEQEARYNVVLRKL